MKAVILTADPELVELARRAYDLRVADLGVYYFAAYSPRHGFVEIEGREEILRFLRQTV